MEISCLQNFTKGSVSKKRLFHRFKKIVNNFLIKMFLVEKILFNIVLGIFIPVLTNPFEKNPASAGFFILRHA